MRPVYKLFTFALLILSVAAFGHNQHQKVIDRVEASVVRITGKAQVDTMFGTFVADYMCTGFVIGDNRVMTVEHCIHDEIAVDGFPISRIVKTDKFYDLALVDVKTSKPPLQFTNDRFERGDNATAIGYGFNWTKLTVVEVKVMLADYAPPVERPGDEELPPGYWMQGVYIEGMSGGPVIDEQGHVMSIVQRRTDEGASYGVGTLLIRAFLLGVD